MPDLWPMQAHLEYLNQFICMPVVVWTPRNKKHLGYFNHILGCLSCISVTRESDQGLQKGTIKQSSSLFAYQIPVANASTGDI